MSADDEVPTLTPLEERLGAALAVLLAQVPADVRHECETLAGLDPACLGMRVHPRGDALDVVWAGRWVGSVSRAWVCGDTTPDGGPTQ